MSQSRFHYQTRHGHARMHVRCLNFSIFDFCKVAKERTLFIRSFLLDICAQRHGVRLLSDDLFVGERPFLNSLLLVLQGTRYRTIAGAMLCLRRRHERVSFYCSAAFFSPLAHFGSHSTDGSLWQKDSSTCTFTIIQAMRAIGSLA